MTVLVAVASRHQATFGLAISVAERLNRLGLAVDVRAADEIDDVTEYEAVVAGSAVYGGAWLREGTEFLRRCRADLLARPVWLFSSGPLSEPAGPFAEPPRLEGVARLVGASGVSVFPGRLDPAAVTPVERLAVELVGERYGDFRDWVAVAEWADDVGRQILAASRAVGANGVGV